MDARREKLKQWKLQKAQQQLQQKQISMEKHNGKKCYNNSHKKKTVIRQLTTTHNHVDTRRRSKTKNLSVKMNQTQLLQKKSIKSNNMKRKHIGMDKENCNKAVNIVRNRVYDSTARKRSNVVIKNKSEAAVSKIVIDNGKDKNDSSSNKTTSSTNTDNSLFMTNTILSSATTQTSILCDSENLDESTVIKNSNINVASQTVFQFETNIHPAGGALTKNKCIEAIPTCHSVGTSTVDDGEINESSHYTDLLNQLNDIKMVVKEKDATINKLKFAHEVTLQQMCELQDELNESVENEESIKVQLEQFKTQLVMNLQIALQKNKQLKDENELLKQQLLGSKDKN